MLSPATPKQASLSIQNREIHFIDWRIYFCALATVAPRAEVPKNSKINLNGYLAIRGADSVFAKTTLPSPTFLGTYTQKGTTLRQIKCVQPAGRKCAGAVFKNQ